ncbi:hypothetical protein ACFLZZ_03690 [Nanoarchaeota archaeon]
MTDKITITKKIAKQGTNAVIVIPKHLQHLLQAGSLVQLEITTLRTNEPQKGETEDEN